MSELRNRSLNRNQKNNFGNENYHNRVQNLFAKISKIQNLKDEDKKEKTDELETLMKKLEAKLEEEKEDKRVKMNQMRDVLKELKNSLNEEMNNKQSMEDKLNANIRQLDNNFAELLTNSNIIYFYICMSIKTYKLIHYKPYTKLITKFLLIFLF